MFLETCLALLQAAYGQSTLTITSFFTYVGLGLGFLGSSLALPFGLYVLICQRTTEKGVQVRQSFAFHIASEAIVAQFVSHCAGTSQDSCFDCVPLYLIVSTCF